MGRRCKNIITVLVEDIKMSLKKKFVHAPPSAHAAKFSFSKNRRDLKMNIFF